jgi:hypothetical protein
MPALSAAVADYDMPADGPVRPLVQLQSAVAEAVTWRLGSQYVRLATTMPSLLQELARALDTATGRLRAEVPVFSQRPTARRTPSPTNTGRTTSPRAWWT